MNIDPLYWNRPTLSNGISHDGKTPRFGMNSRMYYDVTREELLELLGKWEAENSLRSLSTAAKISYQALVDFKRGKSTLLGDKNLRAVMGVLKPQNIVQLVGYINEGSEAVARKGETTSPLGGHLHLDCYELKSDHDDILAPGALLFFSRNQYTGVPPSLNNQPCLVKVEGGPVYFAKPVEAATGHYDLIVSRNAAPILKNAKVEWTRKQEAAIYR